MHKVAGGAPVTGEFPVWVQGLVCRYGTREVVRGLDLSVDRGETVALVGENGCGKTTTMRALTGAIRPRRGTCRLLGEESTKLRARSFERIGFVAEAQEHYDFMTPRQLFDFLATFYPTWDRALEKDLIDRLDLPANQRIHQLSRGGKMKTSLVSSLAYRPEVILLDEPLAGLDELAKESVLVALKAGRGESATLLCSHELDDIEDYVDRVVLMSEGRAQWSLDKKAMREMVRVVRFSHTGLVADLLPTWARFREEEGTARFTDTEFGEERTRSAVSKTFANVTSYSTHPASLKDAFRAFASLRRADKR